MEFIVIPIFVTMAPVLIVLIVLRYRSRQTAARYQALLQLAEKNVALPAELLVESAAVFSERRRALVLIGAALGIMATLLALPVHFDDGQSLRSFWGLGLLPLMTGLGYLLSWRLNQREDARA
ncbi:MAG TPA: DUF6249 domain-containing protein [Luteibacter sp.]|nr:DUF6249 domain-containing protein [Luteibacter sp.]